MGVYKRGETYYISYLDREKKRVRKAMGRSKATAEAVLARIKLDLRAGKYSDPKDTPRTSFENACNDYIRRKADLRGQETLKSTVKVLQKHFDGRYIADITEKEVDDFILLRRDSPTRYGGKRAGASINREVNVLRSILQSAVKYKLSEKNPASCPRKFPEKKRLRYLTEAEASTLLELARTSRSRDAYHSILIALETGMRQGEIFNLRRGDLDYMNGQIWVRETKNGSPRYVPMTEAVRKALSSRPKRLGNDFIFWGRVKDHRDHAGFRECFVNLLQRAGIEDFTFHDLRHTFASHLAMAGVPLHTIGQLLGHKTPAMTMRYAHLAPGHLKNAVNSLPGWESGTKVAQIGNGELENAGN